jgi:23S rRNA pseudouridine2605 synthase
MTDETQRGQPSEPLREPGEADDDRFAVRITVDREGARRLSQRTDLDFGDRPHIRPQSENRAILEAFATRAQIAQLQAEGHPVAIGQNESAAGRARQAELDRGDRFEGGRTPPRGLGRKVGGKPGGGKPGGEKPGGGNPGGARPGAAS